MALRLVVIMATAAVTCGVGEKHFEQSNVFSPQGRLYQAEFASEAVQRHGSPTVAISGRSCGVVATRRRFLGPLVDPSSVRLLHRVTAGVGCASCGVPGDELLQVARLRNHALAFRRKYGCEPPPSLLARALADDAQQATQEAPTRPLGAAVLVVGCEQAGLATSAEVSSTTVRPVVYRVDPSGQFYLCSGAVLGQGSEESTKWLADELARRAQPDQAPLLDNEEPGNDSTDSPGTSEELQLAEVALRCLLRGRSERGEGGCTGKWMQDDEPESFQVGVVSLAKGYRLLSPAEVAGALLGAKGG